MEARWSERVARSLAVAFVAAVMLGVGALIGCEQPGGPAEPLAGPGGPPVRQTVSEDDLGRIRLRRIAGPPPPRILVGATEDSRGKSCSDPCSLREAIRSAEPGSVVEVPAGVYLLRYGGLLVDKDLVIAGAGPESTLIRAGPRPPGEPVSVFMVPRDRVEISGMTIEGGKATWGGGIYNQGHLTLTDLVVRNNEAEVHGGGIFNLIGGTLTLTRSVVKGNTARHGGGIFNDATITVADSALVGNAAIRGKGGGLHNSQGGVVVVKSSAIIGNASRFGGGGIYTRSELTMVNVVVMDNQAGSDGGGIFNWGAKMSITNSTVSHNRAPSEGGGVHNVSSGMMTLGNSIIAENESKVGPDCFTSADVARSLGHNLVGNGVACELRPQPGDMVGRPGEADRPWHGRHPRRRRLRRAVRAVRGQPRYRRRGRRDGARRRPAGA